MDASHWYYREWWPIRGCLPPPLAAAADVSPPDWPLVWSFIWNIHLNAHSILKPWWRNMQMLFLAKDDINYPNSLSKTLINCLGTSKKCLNEVCVYYWSQNCVKSCDFIYIVDIMAAAASVSWAIMVSYIIHYNNILEQFAVFQYISNGFSNRYKLHLNTF